MKLVLDHVDVPYNNFLPPPPPPPLHTTPAFPFDIMDLLCHAPKGDSSVVTTTEDETIGSLKARILAATLCTHPDELSSGVLRQYSLLSGGAVIGNDATALSQTPLEALSEVTLARTSAAVKAPYKHMMFSSAIAVSPCSTILIVATRSALAAYNTETTEMLWEKPSTLWKLCTAMAFSRCGSYVASGWKDGAIIIYHSDTGEILKEAMFPETIHSICITDCGTYVAVCGTMHDVILYTLFDAAERVLEGHTRWVLSVSCGDVLVSASDDRTLRVWDYKGDNAVMVLSGHEGPVGNVVVTQGGDVAVSVDNITVRCWELAAGSCLWVVPASGLGLAVAGCVGMVLVQRPSAPVECFELCTGDPIALANDDDSAGVVGIVLSDCGQFLFQRYATKGVSVIRLERA